MPWARASGGRAPLAAGLLLVGLVACVPSAAPRFPQSVAAALAQHPMRSLETDQLVLLYPEGRQEEARRFLVHVDACARALRGIARVHNGVADQKLIVIMPELPFNNAFVAPRMTGYDTEAVVPTYNTADLFSLEMGQPPDPAAVACHEVVHAIQFQQIAGFAWFWNALFGSVYTPQLGLDGWFDEGLAVYYETKLQPGIGRLAWPFWRGAFAAGFAGRRPNGGDLSVFQRDFHAGNHYLVGSQLIRFLADRYGEAQLWRLIEVQARSIFFPLWVNVRFWQAYDKSLSTLIDEFADEVQANLRVKPRPTTQRVVRAAGYSARYARARDGGEALVTMDHDRPARLMIFAPDGRLRAERNLTDVLPGRRLSAPAPGTLSGLSFSGDGRSLYFVSLDTDRTYQAARLYRYDVPSGRLQVVHRDLRGTGGSVSPDGSRYVFARAMGDHHDLATVDLRTGDARGLAAQPHGTYLAHPRYSPDGSRVVAMAFEAGAFRIALYDAVTGQRSGVLPTGGGPVHDPSWVDDHRIVYLGTAASDAGFQVYVHDLDARTTVRATEAPYLAFEPRPSGNGTIRFLNREGWHWTIDEVAVPRVSAVASPATAVAETTSTPGRPSDNPIGTAAPGSPPPAFDPRSVDAATPAQSFTLPAAAELPLPPILSDRPYSGFDHLFVPRLYGPTIQTVGRSDLSVGLVLSANDRLSLHRWTAAGFYQWAGGGAPSFLLGYTNRQLAPLTMELSAAWIEIHDVPPVPPGQPTPQNRPFTLFRRDRQAAMNAWELFYGNPVLVGFSLLETYRPGDADVAFPLRRFAGPHIAAAFTGLESTPYTGARRLFRVTGDGAGYPRAWNTAHFGFLDARAELDVVLPLPILARHTLTLNGRVRDLVGLAASQPLLVVGGYTAALLGRTGNRPEVRVIDSPLLPPGLAFVEPLRGFEDYPLLKNRILIADVAYRYPFVIDWGAASTFGLLPAFFARQIDLELFAAGATDGDQGDQHFAVGGALSLGVAFGQVPFEIQYQLARRLTDDTGTAHIITLGL